MIENIKKIGILTILIMLIGSVLNFSSVLAATTSLTATPSSTTVKSGGTFTVTVKSSIKLTGWTIALTNNGGCTFSSASGGELTGTTIYGTALNGETSLAKYTFKAPTVTKDTKYTISFSGSEMCDIDTNEVSNTTCKATITVKASTTSGSNSSSSSDSNNSSSSNSNTTTTKTKSNNAYLKTLGVRITDSLASELGVETDEYDFSGFSKNKTSYNVTVPKNVDSLKVFATAADSKATVKVSGNSGFEVGSSNKITIKVTAEDGKTTKTYTIKVTQLAEEEEKPGNLIEEDTGLYLTSLSIEGLDLSPEFAKDTYSYTATLADSEVTELKVDAVANNEKASVDISGNTELVEGENTINVVVTLEGSTEQTVYQVVVTKEAAEVPATTTSENTPTSTTDLIGTIKNYIGIAVAVIVFMIVAVIVLIILLRRENKKLNEDEEYDENIEETRAEEYNVYKNDENEFVNNDIEKDNFIESLYKQRNGNFDDEELNEQEKETLEEISKQTEEIFKEKEVQGQSVEYSNTELYEENPLEVRRKRRGKGKHSL